MILLVILHSLPPTSVKVSRSSWWAFHLALRLEKMEFKVIPVTNGDIIISYLSLHFLCLPTLSLFATKYLVYFDSVSPLDALLPVKGVG